MGGSVTLDIGISNATHVSQLAGQFVEVGGSMWIPAGGFLGSVVGGTISRGVDPGGSWNDIWLGTFSIGLGSSGGEAHAYVGIAMVQESGGW